MEPQEIKWDAGWACRMSRIKEERVPPEAQKGGKHGGVKKKYRVKGVQLKSGV